MEDKELEMMDPIDYYAKPTMFAQTVYLPQAAKRINDYMYSFYEKWAVTIEDRWEDFVTENLYNAYKDLGYTRILELSKRDFKKFLLWALPKYKEEVLNETE